MITTPTVSDFRRFCHANRQLAAAVIAARAFAAVERERVDAYIEPLFRTYGFRSSHTGEPIAHSRDIYMVGDLDEPRVQDFYARCDALHRAHGFEGEPGYCPALVAENAAMDAERALVAAAMNFFGIKGNAGLWGKKRADFLRLILGACTIDARREA